jgi:hypothetical protein
MIALLLNKANKVTEISLVMGCCLGVFSFGVEGYWRQSRCCEARDNEAAIEGLFAEMLFYFA